MRETCTNRIVAVAALKQPSAAYRPNSFAAAWHADHGLRDSARTGLCCHHARDAG